MVKDRRRRGESVAGFRVCDNGDVELLGDAEVETIVERGIREALEQLRPPQRPTLH